MNKFKLLTVILLCVFCILLPFILIGSGIYGCYKYTSSIGTEIEISAIVTDHSESDGDHYSYIDYSYNGKNYKHVDFERKNNNSELTPVGETVMVKISPKYPNKLFSSIKGDGRGSVHIGFWILLAFLSFIKPNSHNKDEYTIPLDDHKCFLYLEKRYRKKLIKLIFPITSFLFYTVLMLIFPDIFGRFMPLASAAVAVLIVLYYLINVIRIKFMELHTKKETLVKKYSYTSDFDDSPSITYYYLRFSSAEREWEKDVQIDTYNAVEENESFYCVYVGKSTKRKPLLAFRNSSNKLVIYF